MIATVKLDYVSKPGGVPDITFLTFKEKEKRKREICRQIDDYHPVNNDLYCKSVSLRN